MNEKIVYEKFEALRRCLEKIKKKMPKSHSLHLEDFKSYMREIETAVSAAKK